MAFRAEISSIRFFIVVCSAVRFSNRRDRFRIACRTEAAAIQVAFAGRSRTKAKKQIFPGKAATPRLLIIRRQESRSLTGGLVSHAGIFRGARFSSLPTNGVCGEG